jgi:hypothetical protein
LQQDRRILECANVADVIEVQVGQQNRFHVLGLELDLAQYFGRHFKVRKLPARHGSARREPRVDEEDMRPPR